MSAEGPNPFHLVIEAQYLEANPPSLRRGIDRYLLGLIESLTADNSVQLTVAMPGRTPIDKALKSKLANLNLNVQFMKKWGRDKNPALRYSLWLNSLDADFVLLGSPHPLPLFGWERVRPTVIEASVGSIAYDMIQEKFEDQYLQKKRDANAVRYTHALWRECDALFAISEATAKDVANLHHMDTPIHVIGSGLESSFLNAPPKSMDRASNQVLYVGSNDARKNVRHAILATRIASSLIGEPVTLMLVGNDFVKGRIQDFGPGGKIVELGRVDDAQLTELYQTSQSLIFASLMEGAGLPILEAMSFGCAVVAYDNSSIPEYAGRHARLAKSGDVAELGRQLATELTKPDGLEGERIKWAKSWTWHRVRDRLVSIAKTVNPPRKVSHQSVNVAGYFRGSLGLGEVGRSVVEALQSQGTSVHQISFDDLPQLEKQRFAQSLGSQIAATTIYCLNPDSILHAWRTSLLDPNHDAMRICVPFYELSRAPVEWQPILQCMDEVWVASEYMESVFRSVYNGPIHVVPIPLPQVNEPIKENGDSENRPFQFGFVFDGYSTLARKNPIGAIQAFVRAFPNNESVELIIKTRHLEKVEDALDALTLHSAIDARIKVINEDWPLEKVHAFIQSLDCYLSLHRAEGLGLTMAEAMSAGVPVIATGFSGNLAFMDDDNSYLVRHSEVPAAPDEYLATPPGSTWGEPDLEHAAQLMQYVHQDPVDRCVKIERARASIAKFSGPACGEVLVAKLADAQRHLTSPRALHPSIARKIRRADLVQSITRILPPSLFRILSTNRLIRWLYARLF